MLGFECPTCPNFHRQLPRSLESCHAISESSSKVSCHRCSLGLRSVSKISKAVRNHDRFWGRQKWMHFAMRNLTDVTHFESQMLPVDVCSSLLIKPGVGVRTQTVEIPKNPKNTTNNCGVQNQNRTASSKSATKVPKSSKKTTGRKMLPLPLPLELRPDGQEHVLSKEHLGRDGQAGVWALGWISLARAKASEKPVDLFLVPGSVVEILYYIDYYVQYKNVCVFCSSIISSSLDHQCQWSWKNDPTELGHEEVKGILLLRGNFPVQLSCHPSIVHEEAKVVRIF